MFGKKRNLSSGEVIGQVGSAVGDIITKSVHLLHDSDPDITQGEFVRLGCNTALCSLISVVPYLAQKPDITRDEARKTMKTVMPQLINADTVLLGALITARMHRGITVNGAEDTGGDGLLLSANGTVEFGPSVIAEALEDWKKLTGKSPDGIFHKAIIEAAAEAARDAIPFDESLEKRAQAQLSSKTLQ